MAGRGSPGGVRTPTRSTTDSTLDLLTGTFPGSNLLFGQEINGRQGVGGAQIGNSPTLVGSNNDGQDLIYERVLKHQQQQQEPLLDLLTGLFPTPSRIPSPVISPTLVGSTSGWRTDVLNGQHPSLIGSGELFGTPGVLSNNPFLDNIEIMSPSLSPPLQPISGQMDTWSDGSFVSFLPVAESVANLDLGSRFVHVSSAGPLTPRIISRPPSAGAESSPATPSSSGKMTASIDNGSNYPQGKDPGSTPDVVVRYFSAPAGIGLDRQQNDLPSADSSRRASPLGNSTPPNNRHSSVSPTQIEHLRRGSSYDTKYDQRSPPGPSISCTQGRESPGLDTRSSMSSTKSFGLNEEFVGAFAKDKHYSAPKRGAVHPRRPVSLELRPRPLRGAPANQVSRLTCLEGSVWATCDLGLMVWDVENATRQGSSGTGNILGDEDAACSHLLGVQGSAASCIISDVANNVVWTGHRDGKMRAWPAHAPPNASRESISATLTFQAHRPAITAVVITPYGELWVGSESGELKAWPWEAVGKALSRTCDGISLMEKCYKELRIGNIGPINPEIRFLVGDHGQGRVWCAGSHYIVIWDARRRERLKAFIGSNGLDLNSLEVESPGREIFLDEDLKVGYAKVSLKKEKGGWLQRSRNAVLGAADAVRRAAGGGGQGGEESRRLEALVACANGTMWGGYGNGVLVQWDWEGYRLQEEICRRPVGVRCICVVGNRLWVGYSDGKLQILEDNGKLVGSWVAHRFGVMHMDVSGGYVFSLGASGSIRGWNISSPYSNLNALLAETMTDRADSYTCHRYLRVLAATWNTAQERPLNPKSARIWLKDPAADASIVVVGLQEVEMGAGAIGMAAVKESVGMGFDKGSQAGTLWLEKLDNVLGEANEFERIGSRQLAGMLIGVWVRRKLLPYVGDVEVGAVACGFGRALGNKGAVGVRLMVYRRTICLLTSHLAAHMEQSSRRNADFEHIYNQMSFVRTTRPNVTSGGNAGVSSAVQSMLRSGSLSRRVSLTSDHNFVEREPSVVLDLDVGTEDDRTPELAEADLLIWSGDLNYRIESLSYEDTVNLIRKKQWDVLLLKDQLRLEMEHGRTFHGLREGPIRFPPTYKFDKWTTDYDTSEKKRIPAWCDRVLFRDSFGSASEFSSSSNHGLVRPCKVSVVGYETCMEPEESDHKPVRCMLDVELSVIDEADRRREYGHIMHSDPQVQSCLAKSGSIPEIVMSTNRFVLENSAPSTLWLSNEDQQDHLLYVIHCTGLPRNGLCPCGQHSKSKLSNSKDLYPRGGYGFPHWLQVKPACGVLGPCSSVSISIKTMSPEDRTKDQQDKVVMLLVKVKGAFSPEYKQHMICVSCGPTDQNFAKEKELLRHRSYDLQGRPSSAEMNPPVYGSRPDQGTSSLTQYAPDLLL